MNNRNKGHRFERKVVSDLRDIFENPLTSRNSSRLMDNMGVDITGIPLLIQCKAGYVTRRPKFDIWADNTTRLLEENKLTEYLSYPKALIHKINRKHTVVTIDYGYFLKLIKKYYNNEDVKME